MLPSDRRINDDIFYCTHCYNTAGALNEIAYSDDDDYGQCPVCEADE